MKALDNRHKSSRLRSVRMFFRAGQGGAVLVVSLFLLLIMTLVAVTAMSTTNLEEKMAGNMRDRNAALQAAEMALKDGEKWITGQATQPVSVSTYCANCVWNLNILPDLSSQPQGWWNANGNVGAAVNGVNTQPRYVMEQLSKSCDSLSVGQGVPSCTYFYRITSRGTGDTDTAQVVVQSTYGKRFN